MNRPDNNRSTIKSLLLFVGSVFLIGLLVLGCSAASKQPAATLKALVSCAIGLLCLLVVLWSIRTGHTGARMLHFERTKNPIGFWLIVAFWAVIGFVVLASSGRELRASFTDYAPNNSPKPNPLRGLA